MDQFLVFGSVFQRGLALIIHESADLIRRQTLIAEMLPLLPWSPTFGL